MKKNLLISLLAVLSISTIHANSTTTETTVVRTCMKYVLDNKLKCTLAAVIAYDAYLHGINGSIVSQGAQYLTNSGLQLYGNAVQACTSTSNTAEVATKTVGAATDYVTSFFG